MLNKPELDDIIDLNDSSNACTITGFLPVHAAAANGLRKMVDFLCDLPGQPHLEHKRAKTALTQIINATFKRAFDAGSFDDAYDSATASATTTTMMTTDK